MPIVYFIFADWKFSKRMILLFIIFQVYYPNIILFLRSVNIKFINILSMCLFFIVNVESLEGSLMLL